MTVKSNIQIILEASRSVDEGIISLSEYFNIKNEVVRSVRAKQGFRGKMNRIIQFTYRALQKIKG